MEPVALVLSGGPLARGVVQRTKIDPPEFALRRVGSYGATLFLTAGLRRRRDYAVQKLLRVQGGLKAYRASPDILLATEQARECPYCPDRHRLRLHGHYLRFALVPGAEAPDRVLVRRLLCARTGRTVSLLPDFCLPRRQHGPAIVGAFLSRYSAGDPLLTALRAVRPDAPGHSVAQALRRGFLSRAGPIRTYLARCRHRALEPPSSPSGRRREVAALLVGLCHGFATAAAAFVHHGVEMHLLAHVGLA